MSRLAFFLCLLTVVCIYSIVRGGQPEKTVVGIFIFGFVMSIVATSPFENMYVRAEVGVLAVDLIMLSAFALLALNAERYWTLWICAMQAIQVLTHFPIMFMPELLPRAYYVTAAFWAYPMLIVLTVGTYRHQQRLRRFGVDRSWSDFSSLQK